MKAAQIQIPPKLIELFTRPNLRYRCAYGGRGSGKTYSFALMTAIKGYQLAEAGKTGVILCAREFMNSLEDSSMEEVKSAIRAVHWLDDYYEIGEKYIRTKNRRIKYTFAGVRRNLDSLKGKSTIHIAWLDEAEPASETAYQKLLPTVRAEDSEIWVTWNPEEEGSPTDSRFVKSMPENGRAVCLNYDGNPWFPKVLEQERLNDLRRLDPNTYAWIWEGDYLENSDRQVFADKWEVAEFVAETTWDGPYYGLDFGFAQDPTAATRCWIYDDCLWIDYEASKIGLELDATSPYLKKRVPDIEKHVVRADNARPESISYLKRQGLPRIIAASKWPGSVEEGIQFMRSFARIYVHPRCIETRKELRAYSHKVDRKSGDVMPEVVDAFNHHIDAIRYSLSPIIQKAKQPSFTGVKMGAN